MALFPNYNMAQGFGNMYVNYLNNDFCTKNYIQELVCKGNYNKIYTINFYETPNC